MKTLEDFTPEIQAKIPEYLDRAFRGVFDGGRYRDFKYNDARDAVYLQYDKCNYKRPLVMVGENPYEAQMMFNWMRGPAAAFGRMVCYIATSMNNLDKKPAMLKELLEDKNLLAFLDNTIKPTKEKEGTDLAKVERYKVVCPDIDLMLQKEIYPLLKTTLEKEKGSSSKQNEQIGEVLAHLLMAMGRKNDPHVVTMTDAVVQSMGQYTNPYLFTLNVWSNGYFAWYTFIAREFKLETSVNAELEEFAAAYAKSNVYNAVFAEEVCIVSKYPERIHRNADNALHSTKGQAVEWNSTTPNTNFKCYYINGRNIAAGHAELALNDEVTKEIFTAEQNDEVRSAWYAYLGEERVMAILGGQQVDTFNVTHQNGEKEVITLFRTKEKLNKFKQQPYAWLKRVCPSTGSVYLTPTDPKFAKAEEAASWHRPDFVPLSVGYSWISRS